VKPSDFNYGVTKISRLGSKEEKDGKGEDPGNQGKGERRDGWVRGKGGEIKLKYGMISEEKK
jgi:hypothetical protein